MDLDCSLITFVVENESKTVPAFLLSRRSTTLGARFQEGETVIVLDDVSLIEFDAMMQFLAGRKHTDGRKFSTTYLLAILKLSVRFNIPEGRVFALRHLDTIQLDEPHEKFLCAVEYKLQQWFIPGFMKIARHPLHWIIEHYYPRLGIVCIQAFAQMHDNIAAFRRDLATWMVPDDMMFPPGPYAFLAEYHSCRKHWRTVIAKVAIKVLSQDGCLFRDDMKELIEGVRETHARTTPEKICEPCFQSGLLDLIRRGRLSNEEELAMQQARTLQSSLFGREALLPLLSDGETPSYSNYDW